MTYLSVMYLPSSAGMLSGRIFAVTGFQSNKNINSGTIRACLIINVTVRAVIRRADFRL